MKEGAQSDEEVVYEKRHDYEVRHPKYGYEVGGKFPFAKPAQLDTQGERRKQFAQWLTSRDNPYFAIAIANRIWSYFLGRGIIDPVDDLRPSNPSSNPPLLAALAGSALFTALYDPQDRLVWCNAAYAEAFVPGLTLPRLGSATLTIQYPWVETEPHIIKVITATGLTAKEMETGLLEEAGVAPADVVDIVHGTTVASNAILELRGADLRDRAAPEVDPGEVLELRRRNVADAFRVERPAALEGRSILLVDDVLTTGATLESALAALAAAGADAHGLALAWAA